MGEKLPYYMVYPMPLAYDDERIERRDFEYMKSMYPDAAKRILPYVEEECDRMEYPGSMMYDEYPDRLQVRLMCSRICDKVRKNERLYFGEEFEEPDAGEERFEGTRMPKENVEGSQGRRMPENIGALSGRNPADAAGRQNSSSRPSQLKKQETRMPKRNSGRNPDRQDWLRNLVEVMLYQEMYKRRQDDRRARRKFY